MMNPVTYTKLDGGAIDLPYFSKDDVPPSHCSRYVRLSAKQLFDIDYPVTHAWKLRKQKNIGVIEASNDTLSELVRSEKVTPGMALGVFYANSQYNSPLRPYSHVSLFVGTRDGEPIIIEQVAETIRAATIADYNMDDLLIKEALFLK